MFTHGTCLHKRESILLELESEKSSHHLYRGKINPALIYKIAKIVCPRGYVAGRSLQQTGVLMGQPPRTRAELSLGSAFRPMGWTPTQFFWPDS